MGAATSPGGGLTRGELARRTGFNVDTILYFEKEGVLPPPDRTAGGHRRYDQRHLRTLSLVGKARALGFTPAEVRELIALGAPSGASCDEVREIASRRRDHIRSKMADLALLESLLTATISRCSGGTSSDCAIIDMLVDERS